MSGDFGQKSNELTLTFDLEMSQNKINTILYHIPKVYMFLPVFIKIHQSTWNIETKKFDF